MRRIEEEKLDLMDVIGKMGKRGMKAGRGRHYLNSPQCTNSECS